MDANVSFTGNLGTDVEMKVGEDWRGARFRVAHTPRVMRQGSGSMERRPGCRCMSMVDLRITAMSPCAKGTRLW